MKYTSTTEYDVVVAGAGPAGISAALEAARSGAKTALIERYGCVGGALTLGFIGPLLGYVCGGTIGEEIENAICPERGVCPDFEIAKTALTGLLDDAGVDLFLQTLVTGVVKEDTVIKAVKINGNYGESEIRGKVFIDSTGDGNLSALAGCQWKIGRETDGLVQPVTIMFTIEGIDPEQNLTCCHEEHYTVLDDGREYLDICHKACKSGELPPNVNIVRLYLTGHPGERMVNATQENRIDPLDPESVSKAEKELRKQVNQITAFLRNNIPGFENIRIRGSASTLGIRESRRIIGRGILNEKDMIAGKTYPDTVVHDAFFCFDVHNPVGPGQAEGEERVPSSPKRYDIPFSAMCPLGFDNLLTAGRCISGTHTAHSSYRVIRICMAMGQAAGAAAKYMSKLGVKSSELSVDTVREHLIKRGVKL